MECPCLSTRQAGRDSVIQLSPESSNSSGNFCQADARAESYSSPTNIQKPPSEGITTQIDGNMAIVGDASFTDTRINSAAPEVLGSATAKIKFQGFGVCSDVLPTLNRIWAKHGNVLEGHVIRSDDLVGWALESLTKVVILLQSNSAKSLNNAQADYMSSTFADLQTMQLNISWLAPYVDKSLKIHKGRACRLKLEENLADIEKL